jgi:hypothetical protein
MVAVQTKLTAIMAKITNLRVSEFGRIYCIIESSFSALKFSQNLYLKHYCNVEATLP